MTARLTFLAIVGFWLTMNVLLWRAEFGVHSGEASVPIELVWGKILSAPDASSMSVFQDGQRMGYCEVATGLGQKMALLDESQPPPEGLAASIDYQLHFAGNVALGDFTNRLKFSGQMLFSKHRRWQELDLKLTSRNSTVEIHSLATNQTVHLKINSAGAVLERDLAFADLQNPNALVRAFFGNFADSLLGGMDLPQLTRDADAQALEWTALRTRVKIGTESVPIYRVETTALGYTVTLDVSTLGEILHVSLPGDYSAHIDEWSQP
jgi:hypothetical protein